MKLIDKIKDLFMDEITDEEEDFEEDEKVEEVVEKKEKDVLPKVMRETIKKEEKIELRVKPEDFVMEEKEHIIEPEKVKEQPKKFNFPLDFEDDIPSRDNKHSIPVENNIVSSNLNVLKMEKEVPKKVAELYPNKEELKAKPKFKASPVISPVYGVLDKNYKKDEVKERDEEMVEMKRPSKKVDFETVRKKAFGNLADEIKDNLLCENCELYKEVKKISALKEDDLLYDMTVDEEKEVTIEKAYDNYEEFGVAYEPTKRNKNNVVLEDDSVIKDATEEIESVKDTTFTTKPVEKVEKIEEIEIPDVSKADVEYEDKIDAAIEEKSIPSDDAIPSRGEKKKEAKVDADFFELIDSMYKERIDE